VLDMHATAFEAWYSQSFKTQMAPGNLLHGSIASIAIYGVVAALAHGFAGEFLMLLPILAIATLATGLSHCVWSAAFSSYVPGTTSAILLLVPLGVYTLRWGWATLPRRHFVVAVVAGLLLVLPGFVRP
jgi:hypothetical protein